jgi:hypothetical protein
VIGEGDDFAGNGLPRFMTLARDKQHIAGLEL